MFVPDNVNDENASSTFEFDKWTQHRSSKRYYRLLLGVLLSVTTRRISPVLFALISFSSAVCVYAQLCLAHPNFVTVQLPLTPFELTAPALGLLLVFRGDNAYAPHLSNRRARGLERSSRAHRLLRSRVRKLIAPDCT